MSMQPDMRAGDQDRDRTVSLLREAFAEGRLTNDEFQLRLDRAHDSKTFGELAELVDDLPVEQQPTTPASVGVPETSVAPVESEDHRDLRKGWGAWLGVSVMVNVIYLATWLTSGESAPYYWPIWVMGPWGAGMLIATLTNRD
jgi:hypothetical protein